jgi:hypothetical protein
MAQRRTREPTAAELVQVWRVAGGGMQSERGGSTVVVFGGGERTKPEGNSGNSERTAQTRRTSELYGTRIRNAAV